MAIEELAALKELNTQLKATELIHLKYLIGLPDGLCHGLTEEANFLTALKKWSGHNPFLFYQSLNSIRPDLIEVACKVKWLCVSSSDQVEYIREEYTNRTPEI